MTTIPMRLSTFRLNINRPNNTTLRFIVAFFIGAVISGGEAEISALIASPRIFHRWAFPSFRGFLGGCHARKVG